MTASQFKILSDRITKALTEAVRNAIHEHLERGNPVYVMKGQKIVRIQSRKRRI